AARRFAAVLRLAVDILEEGNQVVAELLVVVGAAEPSAVAKLDELDAARRAFMLVEQPLLFAARLRNRRFTGFLLRIVEVFLGALLAKVKLLELFLAKHLRDVQDGLIVAFLALHRDPTLAVFAANCLSCAILTVRGNVSSKAGGARVAVRLQREW